MDWRRSCRLTDRRPAVSHLSRLKLIPGYIVSKEALTGQSLTVNRHLCYLSSITTVRPSVTTLAGHVGVWFGVRGYSYSRSTAVKSFLGELYSLYGLYARSELDKLKRK